MGLHPQIADADQPLAFQLARDEPIGRANREFGYNLSDIGRELGLHYCTISKALARYENS